jgi:hypothetical protein
MTMRPSFLCLERSLRATVGFNDIIDLCYQSDGFVKGDDDRVIVGNAQRARYFRMPSSYRIAISLVRFHLPAPD